MGHHLRVRWAPFCCPISIPASREHHVDQRRSVQKLQSIELTHKYTHTQLWGSKWPQATNKPSSRGSVAQRMANDGVILGVHSFRRKRNKPTISSLEGFQFAFIYNKGLFLLLLLLVHTILLLLLAERML